MVLLRQVDMAIMEAREDVLPYHGQAVTPECLVKLCTLAAALKRELQTLHLDLVDNDNYDGWRAEDSQLCRQRLIEFIVAAKAKRAANDAEEVARRERAVERAAGTAAAEECSNLEDAAAVAKREAAAAKAALLEWRKLIGFWSDKKSCGPARQDLKMPVFSVGAAGKLTVYEFEKEWGEYCAAMEYSKEERVKYLKMAV